MSLVFISPCVCDGVFGGVQLSGRIARDALSRSDRTLRSVCYRNPAESASAHFGCTDSKLDAARLAGAARKYADSILVWHADMLKLLPLVRRTDTKTFLFLHGIECWGRAGRLSDALFGFVDVFLTNSSHTWSRFVQNNPRWSNSSHRVVPLGTGCIESCPPPPAALPSAVIIGRMERDENYKGHKELLRAWPLVLKRIPEAQLHVIGAGQLESELKTMAASLYISESVKFLGKVSDEERSKEIQQARCLLLPSRGEGFGLVYLEAMRYARPCLVSTLDAGREVVSPPEAGLAVDPENISAVAESAIRLLSSGAEWDSWSARAKSLYDSNFTAAHFQQRLLAALCN
jgi:phosphatidylinositol alpha-1,6-mannosyltransferase